MAYEIVAQGTGPWQFESMTFELSFLAVAAFMAGFIDSVAGGGGLISLPALLAIGVPAEAALGTNKFQSAFGTSCALLNFWRRSKIVWKVAAAGIPFSLLASIAGAKLALAIPAGFLAKILVVILPPAAILVLFSRKLIKFEEPETKLGFKFWIATLGASGIVGLYDGFFGPGTGTFLIVALVLFSKMPLVNASATAKTFNLASNIGALVTFMASGNIYYSIAIAMSAANIAGNYIGSHYAIKLGAKFIHKLIFVSITLLFGYLIWKYY